MATLQDALTNVQCLETLALPDEQPTIEPEAASVVYEISFDTNFADRTAFITGIGKYNEEATVCSNLVRCLHSLVCTFYSETQLHFPPQRYHELDGLLMYEIPFDCGHD